MLSRVNMPMYSLGQGRLHTLAVGDWGQPVKSTAHSHQRHRRSPQELREDDMHDLFGFLLNCTLAASIMV